MNYKMVSFILGKIFLALGFFMLIPAIYAVFVKESAMPFLVPFGLSLVLGFILAFKIPKNRQLLAKDGFVCVGISWIVMSLIGCIPFVLSGAIPSFTNAFFESVSGFTTTGASVLSDVESLDSSILLWRSLTQWIGGMGVLVFILAVMPKSDSNGSRFMHLLKAEVPGPTVGKIVPRIATTARVLYAIYIVMTLLEIIVLVLGEMNLYEAVNHSLTTASTGGFGIKNDSLASYSAYSQYVIAVFMLLFGINQNIFYLIITGHILKALKSEELRWYLGVVAVSVAVITASLTGFLSTATATLNYSGEEAFRHSLVQVASIITTSGFSSACFEFWPVLTQAVIVALMFCGACAGCTAGGIKISRLLLLAKNGRREVRYITHPRAVMSVKLEGKPVDHETVRGATSYIIMYASIFVISAFAVTALDGCDLVTGFTSVASALNNIGPGLGEIGPAGNFAGFTALSKYILCFGMLAGRLELFPILILFSPATWKKYS